jgi:predicted small secreted protein
MPTIIETLPIGKNTITVTKEKYKQVIKIYGSWEVYKQRILGETIKKVEVIKNGKKISRS